MESAFAAGVAFWLEQRNEITANNVEGVDLRVGQCADGSAVAVYELPDMGHAWPGGSGSMGYSSSPINATEQIWAFFRGSFAG